MTASQLQQHCRELDKASKGRSFNEASVEYCTGYLAAFFDTMIVTEQLQRKRLLCIPRSIPTVRNTAILDQWVFENQSIATTTTAAVALFAAYQTAYGCNR